MALYHGKAKSSIAPTIVDAVRIPEAFGACIVEERDRWVLWVPALLGAGIGIYFSLPVEPPVLLASGLLIVAIGTAMLFRRVPAMLWFVVVVSLMLVGFVAAQVRTALVAAPVLAKKYGPVWVDGQISDLSAHKRGQRIVLSSPRVAGLGADETPHKIRLVVGKAEPPPRVGDWVKLRAMLLPPPEPSVPGAYEFPRQAWFSGLGAVGYGVSRVVVSKASPDAAPPGVALHITAIRTDLSARVRAALPGPTGALAAALITGDRGAIPEPVVDAMRDAGLAHLLAISGLHIGLVAATIFFGVRALMAFSETMALRYPLKKIAAVAALIGAAGYLLLSGATVPTQRAFLMTAIVLAAVMLDRKALSMRLVACAATVILLLTPESLLTVSFQMSFAAVVALIASYEVLGGWLAERRLGAPLSRRLLLYLAGIALTTFIAGLATAPFALIHFSRMVHFGMAANLLAIPIMAFWIMPWAVVAVVLMPLGVAGLALAPMGWGIDALMAVAQLVAGWPGAVGLHAALPEYALPVVAVAGLWLCLWRRPWRAFGFVGLVIFLAAFVTTRPPDLLIDGQARFAAMRADDGALHFTTGRTRSFTAQTWLRRGGQAVAAKNSQFRCDRLGCIWRDGDEAIVFVKDPRALNEDCRIATILISAVPVRHGCRQPRLVIDRFDLWRNGGYAVWFQEKGLKLENVAAARGVRPWTGPLRQSNTRSDQ